MSFFGKNIRKIRSVKSLSQQAFADLFDLKRGTLGAYEEGRSEPKLETIIKIAKHFSIPVDDLLTQELTVNKLLRFKGNFTTDHEELTKEVFPNIPYITQKQEASYIENRRDEDFIKSLPCIQLPLKNDLFLRAYQVNGLEMSNGDKGLFPKDIVVGEIVDEKDFSTLENSSLILAITKEQMILRKLYHNKNTVHLRAEHKNVEEIVLDISEIQELWKIKFVFCHRLPDFGNHIEDKLIFLEEELAKIKSSM